MDKRYEETAALIQEKLARIARNKEKLAQIIIREGWVNEEDYTPEQLQQFAESLYIVRLSYDDEDKCINLVLHDALNYLQCDLAISMLEDHSVEIEGWV